MYRCALRTAEYYIWGGGMAGVVVISFYFVVQEAAVSVFMMGDD